jgi:hypothetical protein
VRDALKTYYLGNDFVSMAVSANETLSAMYETMYRLVQGSAEP